MVYDVNSIDIIGERNDGGMDLFIISSGKFEDSVEQQTLLFDKIETYLVYLSGTEFTLPFEQQKKLFHIRFPSTALPVGVFLIMPSLGGIMTLTCTIFDPNIFLIFSKPELYYRE